MTDEEQLLLDTARELFAEDTDVSGILEDFATSMILARMGWATNEHFEILKREASDRLEACLVMAEIRAKRILSETGPDDMTARKEAMELVG